MLSTWEGQAPERSGAWPGRAAACVLPPASSLPLQALTHVSEDCRPLLEGCQRNRQKWQALAEQQEKTLVNGESGQAKRN